MENKLHLFIEEADSLSSQHTNIRDKLLPILGKIKGSKTGGLGFFIKHFSVEKKLD